MNKRTIQTVSSEELQKMMSCQMPRGCFLARDNDKWVAVDNSTYDFWQEEFAQKEQAVRWLQGEFEVGETAETWDHIDTVEKLAAVSAQQGVARTANEAGLVLGYLEGHEYSLMVGAAGATVRHDEQYGNNHRGDMPYSIKDAIEFCQEQNADLMMRDDMTQDESDEEYQALLKDKEIIALLMERV